MAKNKKNKTRKLTHRYRLVIINDDTYEEKLSFKLSRLNVYVYGGIFSLLLIILTTLLIAFTPLREYIPGYTSTKLHQRTQILLDSLQVMEQRQQAIEAKMKVLNGILLGKIPGDKIQDTLNRVSSLLPPVHKDSLYASHNDSVFRKEVEKMKSYSISGSGIDVSGQLFLSPVKGIVTAHYNPEEKHYAVDIAVAKDTPVKSVFDGVVIFSEWSAATGHVLMIDNGNAIAVYKHNSVLFKHQGDKVKAGEVISLAGSEGKESSGPHLHFELWFNGVPVDPEQYLEFE